MNTPDNVPVDVDADPPRPSAPHRRMTLTFDAFHEYHHKVWLRYARTQVGGRAAAEAVVEAACGHLLRHWNHVLEQESVPAYAWTVLKERIREWLDRNGRSPALTETAAFEAACRGRLLGELLDERDGFTALENGLSLYAAIAELPERQHDAVVLRYVLGCTEEDVAQYLGCGAVAVRTHVRHAKRKLAARLGLRGNHGTGER
ncbi:RNA polymerase sigma factor [Streptomyces sp. DH37]|uniref:RNA polymerase sigma factor n=1 Tax=Streptomyces sp. DH37 TaxID=3040122 RepID=UPI002442AEAB|nr:sigma-70 family RNA polymerase sigma factor [Streptomyces sp. DH37]MDG9702839.1 sigma-70 family RNA polymerase sigma factor [Streptomyces sp. DH37]